MLTGSWAFNLNIFEGSLFCLSLLHPITSFLFQHTLFHFIYFRFSSLFWITCFYECIHGCMCTMCISGAHRNQTILLIWSYKWLWVTFWGHWEASLYLLQEQLTLFWAVSAILLALFFSIALIVIQSLAMVDPDYQLDNILNHLGSTHLGLLVRVISERISWKKKTHPQSWFISRGYGPDVIRKKGCGSTCLASVF